MVSFCMETDRAAVKNKDENPITRMILKKLIGFIAFWNCGRDGSDAAFDASLSDCIDYYRIITVNRIQLLLLWITGLCPGGDTMDGERKGKTGRLSR